MARSLAFYRRLGLEVPPEADKEPHVEAALPGGLRLAWDTVETIRSFDAEWAPPSGGHRMALSFRWRPRPRSTGLRSWSRSDDGHKEPWDAFWGMRYAIVYDPDGNAVDLFAPKATG